jgi:hypothetical protein
MEYKFYEHYTTRQVEPFVEYIGSRHSLDKLPPAREADFIRAAILSKWFDGDAPTNEMVGDMEPIETLKLGTEVLKVYNRIMGFDFPNLPARSRTTSKT